MGFRIISARSFDARNCNVTVLATDKRLKSAISHLSVDEQTHRLALAMIDAKEKTFTLHRPVSDNADAAKPLRLSVVALGSRQSRHMPKQDIFGVKLNDKSFADNAAFIVALDDETPEAYEGIVAAILRQHPLYTRKTEKKDGNGISGSGDIVIAVASDLTPDDMLRLEAVAEIVPLVMKLVDMPALELNCEEFAKIAKEYAENSKIAYHEIAGDDLLAQGFGGLYHVGKSGVAAPRLVALEYRVKNPRRHVALVGKGLIYDTGGLCLKPRDHMATMKSDMGGAAAVLGAVLLAAKTHLDCNVTAILCIAENGIGPNALRPDDIIALHSGLTVEINNTDAEGRLVLGDGVSYAGRHYNPDVIVDMATLTGAQLMCTGKRHAGLLTKSDEFEKIITELSYACGEPVMPMIYAPEMLLEEFKSDVADMKNSCKDRLNAQSSCAGHFVEKHLPTDYNGSYAHIDIAGPAWNGERATGYGVLLLDAICRM